MIKRSFNVFFIQIVGLILGIVSMLILVNGMGPEVYALVGIYNTICGLIVAFTSLGIETVIARNALFWKEKGNTNEIIEHVSQAVFLRIICYIVLLPFIIGYFSYINKSKYGGQFTVVFVAYTISMLSKAVIDSIRLTLKAIGKYEMAQIIDVCNNTFIKIVGIIVFLKFGAIPYLLVFSLTPVVLSCILIIYCKEYISIKSFDIKAILKKVKESKYLWLRGYIDWVRNYADGLLVSIFFPASIMGSYSVFKNIEQYCKMLIEGFFDVLTQETVRMKGNQEKINRYYSKMNIIRWCVIGVGIIFTIIYWYNRSFFIDLVGFSDYKYIDIMILFVAILELSYLLGKIEINVVALFDSPKHYFYMGIVILVITLTSFALVIVKTSVLGMLLQRVFVSLFTSLYTIFVFRKKRKIMFTYVGI